jgi:peptidoglycan/xylan/chitin deacetylase (PgdA/CDA1 family)
MTNGDEDGWRVPGRRSWAYRLAKDLAHRLQASLAWPDRVGAESSPDGVRILAYHRVCSARDDLAVAPRAFREQMKAVLFSGARPVSLDEGLDVLETGTAGSHVCVTFDDAYRDNLEHAVPVLRDLRIPATIFVPSAVVDGSARLYWYDRQPPVLSWAELGEIAHDPLFSIGAHTRTHPALPRVSDAVAWREIADSKRDVEEQIGRPVTSFAYPAGLHGERERGMVRDAGYRMGVTTVPGLNRPGQAPEALHRSIVDRRDTLRMFEAKLAGLLDQPWGFDDLRALRRRLRSRYQDRVPPASRTRR